MAVSALDLVLGDDFTLRDTFAAKRCSTWADIEEELGQQCVECFVRFDRKDFRWEKVYSMPIVGHKLFSAPTTIDRSYSLAPPHLVGTKVKFPKSLKKFENLMPWRGRVYSVDSVFMLDGLNRLKKLFPVHLPPANTIMTSSRFHHVKKLTNYQLRNGSAERVMYRDIDLNHTTSRYHCSGWRARNGNDYLQIDLGKAMYLTHLGTAGGFPELTTFPSKQYVSEDEYALHKRECNASGYAHQVWILKHNSHQFAWCTDYELSYRHVLTKKWVRLGTFRANSDAVSEEVTDLYNYYNHPGGLYTRFLRIKPINYSHQPMLRLALYGFQSIDAINSDKTSSAAKNKNSCNASTTTTIGDSTLNCRNSGRSYAAEDVIEVVVQEPKILEHCLDGQIGFYGARAFRDYYDSRDRSARGRRRSGKGNTKLRREEIDEAIFEAIAGYEVLDFVS